MCVQRLFMSVSTLVECGIIAYESMRVGMDVCICVCLFVCVYMSGRVSDATCLRTSQALQGLEAHLPPPLPLPVADALRHRCIGGSLCPGVGARVPTGSLLGGCLSGHGAWGSLGPLRGWGALGLSARGSVTQAQLAAGGAHGHVTATPPGFCSAAAE